MTIKRDNNDKLRQAAEQALLGTAPAASSTAAEASPQALLHELQVHQIELEIQNKSLLQAQIGLEEARDRYASLFDFAPVAYLSLSTQGILVEANRAAGKLLGLPVLRLIGRPFEAFVADLALWRMHWPTLWEAEPDTPLDLQLALRYVDGTKFPAHLQCMVVETPDALQTLRMAIFDTTERSRLEAEILRQAHIDALTRLPNRRLLLDRLTHALSSAARYRVRGAILFLDLDNFKTLNDRYGHDAGDQLLIEVARRLKAGVRDGDTVARMGGDEFVMILEGLGTEAESAAVLARQIGNKLNEAIAHRFVVGGIEFPCSASIGVRLFEGGESIEELLKHADLAMYQAKAAGRGQVRFFDASMQAVINERARLECALSHTIEKDQLLLFYQPQFDGKQSIFGVEALLRWDHPQQGLIEPSGFIALAEQSGLILPIGNWVLGRVCMQIARWSNQTHTQRLTVAVNISPRQFQQKDFVEQIREVLAAHGANPSRLVLELTEGSLLAGTDHSMSKIAAIRGLGVRFSIDHFGTGLTSLANLARQWVDQLKIDMAFVSALDHSGDREASRRIFAALSTLAQGLGMSVIAHNVETTEQRALLISLGCEAYQGRLFCIPLPLESLQRMLDESAAL